MRVFVGELKSRRAVRTMGRFLAEGGPCSCSEIGLGLQSTANWEHCEAMSVTA